MSTSHCTAGTCFSSRKQPRPARWRALALRIALHCIAHMPGVTQLVDRRRVMAGGVLLHKYTSMRSEACALLQSAAADATLRTRTDGSAVPDVLELSHTADGYAHREKARLVLCPILYSFRGRYPLGTDRLYDCPSQVVAQPAA